MKYPIALLTALSWSSVAWGSIQITDPNQVAGTWGPDNPSYGQTFTVPAGETLLLDYSFTIGSLNDNFLYVSQLYAWNGSAVVGPALFTSPSLLSPVPHNFETVTFSPSVSVVPGQQYIALVTNRPFGIPL